MMSRVLATVGAVCISACMSACISISSTGSGDIEVPARTNAAISDALEASKTAEDALTKKSAVQLNEETSAFIARHFAEADRLTKSHAAKVLPKDFFMSSFLPGVIRQRRIIVRKSIELSVSYVVIDSPSVEAIAFPSGKIFLSKPLAEGFNTAQTGFDPILLGILIHELTHIRGGHTMEQWATSEGRRAWMGDTVLNAVTAVTKYLPFLSIEHNIEHSSDYAAAQSLSKLSEYAADLAAVTLLREAGHDDTKYINFLGNLHDSARASDRGMLLALGSRLQCLEMLRATKFSFRYPALIIGSDIKAFQVIDLRTAEAIARDLDDPEALASHFKDKGQRGLPAAQMREEALEALRGTMYLACAVESAMPVKKLERGVLQTPFFDTSLFAGYL